MSSYPLGLVGHTKKSVKEVVLGHDETRGQSRMFLLCLWDFPEPLCTFVCPPGKDSPVIECLSHGKHARSAKIFH